MKKVIILISVLALLRHLSPSAENDSDFLQLTPRPYFVYHAATEVYINTADSALIEARLKLINILGDSLTYRPTIYIADNMTQFRQLVGSAFPDWGAAAALPYREMIAIKSPAHFPLGRSLRELLQHEYSHLALAHRLRHAPPPRWLDEGLAMYISAEWGWGENLTMTRAALFNSLVPLGEIERMNRFSEGKAMTAYSQSYLAVKYLLDNYGPESFNIFLDRLRDRQAVDSALMAAIGSGYDGFEKEFFAFLKERYTLMSLLADTIYIWIILALIVLIFAIIYFVRRKKYFRRWDDEDRLQSRDFDYGDSEQVEREDDEDKPWA